MSGLFAAVHESVYGPFLLWTAGQSMSALPGYFRRQLVQLSQARHRPQCRGI